MAPTVTAVLASAALLSSVPLAHALVAPSAVPRHRLAVLRYQDLPSPDETNSKTHPVFRGIRTLREQAKTIKERDRRQYFDFVNGAQSAVPGSASLPPPLQHLGVEESSHLASMASVTPDETPIEAPDAAPSSDPSSSSSPYSLLLSLPSSVASLWVQARTVAEDDRRVYFDFVKNHSLDANVVTESGLSTGLEQHEALL